MEKNAQIYSSINENELVSYIARILVGRDETEKNDPNKYKVTKWSTNETIKIYVPEQQGLIPYYGNNKNELITSQFEQKTKKLNEITNLKISFFPNEIEGDIEFLGINKMFSSPQEIERFESRTMNLFSSYNTTKMSFGQNSGKQSKSATCKVIIGYDDYYQIKRAAIHMYSGEIEGAITSPYVIYNISEEELNDCLDKALTSIMGLQSPNNVAKNLNGTDISSKLLLGYLYDKRVLAGMSEENLKAVIREKLLEE